MMDFAAARRAMVDGQVRTSDVTDPRVIAAMQDLPRERFVPQDKAALAYLDLDVPLNAPPSSSDVRYLLKPMVLAKLVQAAAIEPGQHVLDVGCATGYSSAVLARLGASVVGLEQDLALARAAETNLAALAVRNVTVVTGSLAAGWPAAAPYNVIFVNGASEVPPRELFHQLAEGGSLLCVLGRSPAGKAFLYRRVGNEFSGRPIFDASAPLLPGFVAPLEFVF